MSYEKHMNFLLYGELGGNSQLPLKNIYDISSVWSARSIFTKMSNKILTMFSSSWWATIKFTKKYYKKLIIFLPYGQPIGNLF